MLQPTYLLENEFSDYVDLISEKCPVRKKINKGEMIYMPNDKRDFCYYIINGVAAFFLGHESGKDKITTFRGEGTIFPLYYKKSHYNMENHLFVKAVTDMEVIVIPKEILRTLMLSVPEIALAMSNAYCKYCSILLYDLEGQLFESYVCRTCNFLYVYTKYMRNMRVRLTHEDIAQATGITRANVSRVISKLKKEKILSCSKNGFEIVDEEGLLLLCSGDFID